LSKIDPDTDPGCKKILAALARKVRPYECDDIAMATQMTKKLVSLRLSVLAAAGLVHSRQIGHRVDWRLGPNQ
jgi:hypothetical protein